MGRLVKCAYCENLVDKDLAERYKDKNFHKECCKIFKERDELAEYICELFKLKKAGPRNYTLMKRFQEENGYSYTGMLNALKYFYEVRHNSIEKSNSSIGIIPYVYEEAQRYYNKVDDKKETFLRAYENSQKTETKQIIVMAGRNNRKRKLYDLEDIGVDND